MLIISADDPDNVDYYSQYFALPHIVQLDSDQTPESGGLSMDFTIFGNWNNFCQIFWLESGGLPADSGQTTAAG